jgi:hypothetical protein
MTSRPKQLNIRRDEEPSPEEPSHHPNRAMYY